VRSAKARAPASAATARRTTARWGLGTHPPATPLEVPGRDRSRLMPPTPPTPQRTPPPPPPLPPLRGGVAPSAAAAAAARVDAVSVSPRLACGVAPPPSGLPSEVRPANGGDAPGCDCACPCACAGGCCGDWCGDWCGCDCAGPVAKAAQESTEASSSLAAPRNRSSVSPLPPPPQGGSLGRGRNAAGSSGCDCAHVTLHARGDGGVG